MTPNHQERPSVPNAGESTTASVEGVPLPFALDGKSVTVVTMHGKMQVIETALAVCGLRFLGSPSVDTDRFGTFTREIARAGTQYDALLIKAHAGLDRVPDADFAVASEGTFGPHPHLPFLAGGFEMVALLERRTGKAIIGRHLSSNTNFMQSEARCWHEVEVFAARVGFPGHAVVVMQSREGPVIAKGVIDPTLLKSICHDLIASSGSVWLESDMRAHLNPTRMRAIGAAAEDLLRRLQARCPHCRYPNWIPRLRGGRPCQSCGGPTSEAWTAEFLCEECGYCVEDRIDSERFGAPAHCANCNP